MSQRKAHVPRCGAKTRQVNADGSRKLCQNPGTRVGGRCYKHGGASPVGVASPHFVDGSRSKYMPAVSVERFRVAEGDPQLFLIRQDLALIEVLLAPLMLKLPKTKKQTQAEKVERRIRELVQDRRRLIEAEGKRLTALQQTITVAQFLTAMRAVADLIREFVADETERRAFQQRLAKMLLPAKTTPQEAGDDET